MPIGVPFEQILHDDLAEDPTFRAEWERTALARAVAIALVRYRAEHQLSQRALATELGVRQPVIARLELGEHNPSIETLRRLAAILGMEFVLHVAPDGRSPRWPDPIEDDATVQERVRSGASTVVAAVI